MGTKLDCESSDSTAIAAPPSDEDLGMLCKALAHPARIQILKILIDKGVCISGDLSDSLPLAASTVSEHLRILKQSGLVTGSVDGARRNYCVDRATLTSFKHFISQL